MQFVSSSLILFLGFQNLRFRLLHFGDRGIQTGVCSLWDEGMDSVSVLKMKIDAMIWASQAKDATIATLQRELTSALEDSRLDKAMLLESTSRSLKLEKEMQEGLVRENGLQKQLKELQAKHLRDMAEMELRHDREVESLLSSQQVLEEAEERLCAQLGDLEVEAFEQNRFFNSEISSLSSKLAARETELATALSELESLRQRRQSIKELETIDLAGQLTKSKQECDSLAIKLRDTTDELVKAKVQVTTLRHDLTAASEIGKHFSMARESHKDYHRSSTLCRAESLKWLESQRGATVPV